MASRDTGPSRARDGGYTLTELLVVLLILGLLAAALTPITIGQMNQAKARTAKLQMEGVAAALALYVGDVGRLPDGLRALVEPPASAPTWAGPYLRSADRILDPWGRPIQLVAPASDGRPFVLRSLGADGAPGGKGADADIEVF